MKKILLMLFLILLVGCQQCPECAVCQQCPECKEVVKLQTETKYVCPDKSVVDDPYECVSETAPVEEEEVFFVPITTNEVGTHINEVTVQPACTKYGNGGSIYYKVETTPDNVTFQYREQSGEYKDFFTYHGLYEQTLQFVACDHTQKKTCSYNTMAELPLGKKYLFRVMFNFKGKQQYSNEHIVDLTESSDYMTKTC